MSLMRHVCLFPSLALFAAVAANAQSLSSESTSQLSPGESSSSVFQLVSDDDLSGASALHDAAAGLGAGSGAGQADHGGGHGLLSSLAFEAGGGFNAPTGDSSNDITWGGNITVGAGLHFSRGVSLLAEYQLLDDKLPGNLIAETGANGGNAHIWSLTLNPVVDLFPKSANSVYVTGGGGFYRKVTNFTDPQLAEYCDYFYCETGYQNTVVGHFSSNQGGFNIGGGFTHRLGGVYGDGRMKLFAEVRFLDVLSPASAIAPNGLGTATVGSGTRLVPVTFGVRW
jgi:hypothetical protein